MCDVMLILDSTSTTIIVTWTVSSCEGAFPMSYEVQWNSTDSAERGTFVLMTRTDTEHVIEDLRSDTNYDIFLTLFDGCGAGSILNKNISTLFQG